MDISETNKYLLYNKLINKTVNKNIQWKMPYINSIYCTIIYTNIDNYNFRLSVSNDKSFITSLEICNITTGLLVYRMFVDDNFEKLISEIKKVISTNEDFENWIKTF